jgi:tetratricopeptide (TPR) repeat protein
MCLELGKYNRATVHFSKAQAFDVNNAELMIGLGNAYGAMENYASARTLFEEALKLESSRDEACYGLARLESAQGNPLKAIEMLKKGLDYLDNTY